LYDGAESEEAEKRIEDKVTYLINDPESMDQYGDWRAERFNSSDQD